MYQYLNHCRALAIGLFLSWSLVGLSDLGLAQDDFDQYAGHGDVFDQAYDVDGTLIHVSTIWSFQSNSSWLVVKTSPDHGQTWNPIYEGQVQNIDFIKHGIPRRLFLMTFGRPCRDLDENIHAN